MFGLRCATGSHFLSRMKYLSVVLVQELVHSHTSMATDYSKELDEWTSTDYYDEHVHKIQLPYAQVRYMCKPSFYLICNSNPTSQVCS